MRAIAFNSATKRISIAYAFSKTGEFAFEAAFAVAIVSQTNADLLLIGLIYFLRYLPSIVFSPLGGWLADNKPKKKILIAAEVVKISAALILFLAFQLWGAATWIIVMAAMILTAADCVYAPAFRAYFPDVVDNDLLPSLNSGLQAIEDCASITGPLIFALIVLFFAPAYTFILFSACLLMAIVCASLLPRSNTATAAAFNGADIFKHAFHGMLHMKKINLPLFTVIGCTTLCALFATSILRFILPASIIETFQSEAAVGLLFSLLAVGTVLGSFLYEKANPTISAHSVVKYWWIYGGLMLAAAITLEFSTPLFVAVLFCVGFAGAFVDISIITCIQSLSAKQEVGRNFSLYYFTAVIGDALSGLLASLIFLIAGPATLLGMSLLLSLAPLGWRGKKHERTQDHLNTLTTMTAAHPADKTPCNPAHNHPDG